MKHSIAFFLLATGLGFQLSLSSCSRSQAFSQAPEAAPPSTTATSTTATSTTATAQPTDNPAIAQAPDSASASPTTAAPATTPQSVDQHTTPTDDLLIVPGKRVGPITASITRSELETLFGAEALIDREWMGAEGEPVLPATQVDLGDRSLTIVWTDVSQTNVLGVTQFGSAWKTPEGIGVGTSLAELQQILGPFQLFGFGWDYGGNVHLQRTALANYLGKLVFSLSPDPALTEAQDPNYLAVMGEAPIDSSNPNLQAVNPAIDQVFVYLR